MAATTMSSRRPLGQNVDLQVKRVVAVVGSFVVQLLVLFGCAGDLTWRRGWLFAGLYLLGILFNGVVLKRKNPAAIESRATTEGMATFDKAMGFSLGLAMLGVLAVAGLDHRHGWTTGLGLDQEVLTWSVGLGIFVFAFGMGVVVWAMVTNSFFSAVVRIMPEQKVVTTGPYRFIRHPGYVGMFFHYLGIVLMLGSAWALLPFVGSLVLVVVRTALEDRLLHEELPGYREYAKKTRFRLVPGVW